MSYRKIDNQRSSSNRKKINEEIQCFATKLKKMFQFEWNKIWVGILILIHISI